jgi:hypothetical protein
MGGGGGGGGVKWRGVKKGKGCIMRFTLFYITC